MSAEKKRAKPQKNQAIGYAMALFGMTLCGAAQESQAISASCASLNSSPPYSTLGYADGTYEAGEKITFTTTAGGITSAGFSGGGLLAGQNIMSPGSSARTVAFEFPQTGFYKIVIAVNSPSTVTVTCEVPSDSDSVEILAKTVGGNLPILRQTTGLVSDRIRTALPRGNFKGLNGNKPVGLAALSTDTPGTGGAAGGEADRNIAAWANFAWTAANSDDPAIRSDTDSFTTAAGVDTFLTPNLLTGAAVSVSYSDTTSPRKTVESQEIGFMITPYAALALDDVFSIDASLGYGLFFADNSFLNETLKGDTLSHRYFLSTSASGLTYWDRFGLQGDVGLFWSQSFQDGYHLSDNTEIDDQDASLGTLFTHIRPSYVVYSHDDTAIEPFAAFGYEYDYTRSKVSGATNDRDMFTVGGGISLFGEGLSGELAAETELGRENQDSTTVSGTLRIDF